MVRGSLGVIRHCYCGLELVLSIEGSCTDVFWHDGRNQLCSRAVVHRLNERRSSLAILCLSIALARESCPNGSHPLISDSIR